MAKRLMNVPVRPYREKHGLSREQLAAQLSEALGRPVSAARIQSLEESDPRGRRTPKSYMLALGLREQYDGDDDSAAGGTFTDDRPEQVQPDFDFEAAFEGAPPPQPPPGTIPMRPPASDTPAPGGLVQERIEKFYAMLGAGASMVTHNDGYAAVADDSKRELAKAWVAASRDNENVRKIVDFMESGGPVGELVVVHLMLVFGWVYVSGRAPALSAVYGHKFQGYHNHAAAARALEQADGLIDDLNTHPPAGFNAANGDGAEGAVGDTRRFAE